jgi:UDP-N-acetylmuramate--alanine ligase
MFDEFLTTFGEADKLLVTDIYAASETPIEGVTAPKLVDGIRAMGHPDVTYIADRGELLETLYQNARPGDMIITMGAGDLNRLAAKLYERLKEKFA